MKVNPDESYNIQHLKYYLGCPKCKYEWTTESEADKITCPNCSVKSKRFELLETTHPELRKEREERELVEIRKIKEEWNKEKELLWKK